MRKTIITAVATAALTAATLLICGSFSSTGAQTFGKTTTVVSGEVLAAEFLGIGTPADGSARVIYKMRFKAGWYVVKFVRGKRIPYVGETVSVDNYGFVKLVR